MSSTQATASMLADIIWLLFSKAASVACGGYSKGEKALLVLLVGSELSPWNGLLETKITEYMLLVILILMRCKKYTLVFGPKAIFMHCNFISAEKNNTS